MSRAGKMIVKERSKDFKGSITRLIGNLRPWKLIMIMALTLAMISAILSLIAPDKLSALADEITKGIKPNQENLELIGIKIGENFTEEKLNSKNTFILGPAGIGKTAFCKLYLQGKSCLYIRAEVFAEERNYNNI